MAGGTIATGGRNPRLPWYHVADSPVTTASACSGVCATKPVERSSHNVPECASRQASHTQPLRTSRSIAGLASTTRDRRSRVASTTIARRVGSWISTICQGRPVRRSLCAPSMTPSSDVTLCGSFVPQPYPVGIDVAEVVLEADSGDDGHHGSHDARQDRASVIARGIVRRPGTRGGRGTARACASGGR